jgi:hypothetical protein
MTDAETPPEDSIEERFRIVHDHLDLVDRTLDELAGELETELEAVLENTPIDVEYDIDTGSFQAALSIEHVVSRLNERLEPPLFARVEDETETIRIGDIRRLYEIDPETLTVEEGPATALVETGPAGQRPALKDIIRQLQQADEHRIGVPESAVIELGTYAGCSRDDIRDELQRLHEQGEIYSPKQGYVRLV